MKKAKAPSKPATRQSSPKLSVRVEKVGVVTVDTGTVVIIDPCWISDHEVIDQAFPSEIELGTTDDLTCQLEAKGRQAKFDVGVVAQTGRGDGRYPVFATIVTYDGTETVDSLHIAFLPEITMCRSQGEIQAAEEEFRRSVAHQHQG